MELFGMSSKDWFIQFNTYTTDSPERRVWSNVYYCADWGSEGARFPIIATYKPMDIDTALNKAIRVRAYMHDAFSFRIFNRRTKEIIPLDFIT